ncbi:hypothetical protein [Aquimarina agarivorans]|uniref:hypothetical protein n=1 Tax=Aquimarina agarivorans TaxID=980584 RepID=UPI000248E7A6|nr:hypothetical protein [Aquimarina agarivorans]
MNKRFEQLIDTLENKLLVLLKTYTDSEKKNQSLQLALAEKEAENEDLKKKLTELKHQNDLLKNANALLGSDEYKRETKLKINALVKEIDQCIAQLS